MALIWAVLLICILTVAITYFENFRKVNRMIFPLEKEIIRYLRQYYPFYQNFSFRRKRKFEKRVRSFLNSFEYQLRGNMRLTHEVQAVLGGAAARMTMYLPEACFNYYTTIVLYPLPYRSRYTGKNHKGEVNPAAQTIVFSWASVVEGVNRDDDGMNLLLHEYAHALFFEHQLMNHEYEVFNEEAFRRVMEQAELEIQKIRSGQPHVLRKYAATNLEEFFAVAVENFFERSAQFKANLPELYGTLVLLFRQDPVKN